MATDNNWTEYSYLGELEDGTVMEFVSDSEYYEYMEGENE